MKKLGLVCFTFVSLTLIWASHAEDKRYISDELSTYIHTGPSTQYRIITALRNENQDLKNQLIVAQKKVDAANVQLDDKQREIILQWFLYGDGVAGIGLLLPHLIPSRKKNDRWMR